MSFGKPFHTWEDLPRVTEKGFAKERVPDKAWSLVSEMYSLLRDKIGEEYSVDPTYIHDSEGNYDKLTEFLDIENFPTIREIILQELHPVVEEWCGESVVPHCMYGIRSYKDGAQLRMHKDRVQTHHESLIIVVDKKVAEDWPLHIIDHQGEHHDIYTEPGEMILYESAVCEHGRPESFEGEFFRNLFVHYSLYDWAYVY